MSAPDPISAPESAKPTLLLIDGSSYLYRAFHAMPDLRGPGNAPTGALHGMVNMLGWIRDHIQAEHAVCVFDAKGPTFRDALETQYVCDAVLKSAKTRKWEKVKAVGKPKPSAKR